MPQNVQAFLDPTDASAVALLTRTIEGPLVMLNLLRLRATADYRQTPELTPTEAISGRQAYQLYIEHTLPYLEASGGRLLFLGAGGDYFVGPEAEGWDLVMLVEQSSVDSFIAFATDDGYLAGVGHRTAAVSDSRMLPLETVQSQLHPGGS